MRFSLATVAAVASLSGLATAYPWNEDNELYARDVDGSLYAREASSYYGEHDAAFDDYDLAKRDVDFDHDLLRRDLLALSALEDADLERLMRRGGGGFLGKVKSVFTPGASGSKEGGGDPPEDKKGKGKYQPLDDMTEEEKEKAAKDKQKAAEERERKAGILAPSKKDKKDGTGGKGKGRQIG